MVCLDSGELSRLARDSVPIQRRRVYQQDFHDPVKHIL